MDGRELRIEQGPVVIVQTDDDPGDMGEPRIITEDGATVVFVPRFTYWLAAPAVTETDYSGHRTTAEHDCFVMRCFALADELAGLRATAPAVTETADLRAAGEFMLRLVEEVCGTDHEPDPENANDAGAWEAEAEYRKHRDVIRAALAGTSDTEEET